jgi:hypothetical protein
MSTEDFEKKLQGARMREVPAEWRGEIMGGLRKQMEHEAARKRGTWRDLLWPSPLAWTALACIWCGIWVSNMGGPSPQTPPAAAAAGAEMLMARLAQERSLAENKGTPDL